MSAQTLITIDAAKDRHPISRNIYGLAFATPEQLRDLNVPLNRSGGNATTRYNWQLDASNRAGDWFFESIGEESALAGKSVDDFIAQSRSAGAQSMITIPMIGWVAKLGARREKLSSYSVAKYGPQQYTDPYMPDAGNGVKTNGAPVTNNDPHDANIEADALFQRAWVQHLVTTGAPAFYLLDNEHSIWFATHRDVKPTGATMDEIRARIIDYAQRIREADPHAVIGGPEEWGWGGYI